MLHELKEEFALTVKQAKATSLHGRPTHRRSINQDAARVDFLERPEELSVLVVCENQSGQFSKRGIFLCMSALLRLYLDLVFF